MRLYDARISMPYIKVFLSLLICILLVADYFPPLNRPSSILIPVCFLLFCFVFLCVCICLCMYICAFECLSLGMFFVWICVCVCLCVCECLCLCIYIFVCFSVCVLIYMCMYVWLCMCICVQCRWSHVCDYNIHDIFKKNVFDSGPRHVNPLSAFLSTLQRDISWTLHGWYRCTI